MPQGYISMIRVERRLILLTAGLFIFSLLFGGSLPFFLFYALLIMLLASNIYIRSVRKAFDVEVTCSETLLNAGASSSVLTKLKFDLPLPVPYVEVRSNAFAASRSDFSGYLRDTTWDENIWIENELKFPVRGIHRLDDIHIRISDLFRSTFFEKSIDTGISIKVYPKIYKISSLYLGGLDIYHETTDPSSTSEDQSTIRDVRKYREGDSLKKVHWKLSAKQDDLYVKNLDTISGEEMVLFIDMNCLNYTYDNTGAVEESIIDFAASVINQLIRRDLCIKVFLNTSTGRYFELEDKPGFNRFLDFIITQKSDSTLELYQYIYENTFRLHRMNRIAIITAGLDAPLAEALLQMGRSGYSISVFCCADDTHLGEHSSMLANAQVECRHFSECIEF